MNEILAELERLYSGYNPFNNDLDLLDRIDCLEMAAEIDDLYWEDEQFSRLDKAARIEALPQ